MAEADFIVIGAGIAGASAAYRLAGRGQVVLLEREDQPGFHTTGRSAALYSKRYKNPLIRGLAIASGPFLESPPSGFADHPILTPRGLLCIGRADQREELAAQFSPEQVAAGIVRELSREEAMKLAPHLDPDYVAAAMYLPDAQDIDVNGLHQGFLRGMRAQGGQLVTNADVRTMARRGGKWHLETSAGAFSAPVIVNAAGAWVVKIAELAGVRPVGLVPKRRTAITFDPPAGMDPSRWPMVMDAGERFYLKPEAGRVLASPCDETPMEPHDVQPDEMDVAVAVDLIEQATTLRVRRITHRWAGLRSFVPDRMPVAGTAPDGEGFVFLAGQGGFGIMTSEALGRCAVAAATGEALPADIAAAGVSLEALSPRRLAAV